MKSWKPDFKFEIYCLFNVKFCINWLFDETFKKQVADELLHVWFYSFHIQVNRLFVPLSIIMRRIGQLSLPWTNVKITSTEGHTFLNRVLLVMFLGISKTRLKHWYI